MLPLIGVLCCLLCLAVGTSFAAQPAEFNPEYVRDQKSLHGPWQAAHPVWR